MKEFSLAPQSCRQRQSLLLERVASSGIEAALILDRSHVHYFTGFWARSVFRPCLLLKRDGSALLALPYAATSQAAEVIAYEGTRLGTFVDDGLAVAVNALLKSLSGEVVLASDLPLADRKTVSIADDIRSLRRRKWPDELAILRRGIEAAKAGYTYASKTIAAELIETDLYAGLLSSISRAAGEPIGELGNDFQSGSPGGPPRDRAMQSEELLPLDLGVSIRGYHADLCRTFAVSARPSRKQRTAHAHVMDVLLEVESLCKPGVSCRMLYEKAAARLDGFAGARFGHHLGHGTGLSPHEAPRLNPQWNDALSEGDVFTLEPGLYHADLCAGLRVEQMYLVTATGIERLSDFPTDLNHG